MMRMFNQEKSVVMSQTLFKKSREIAPVASGEDKTTVNLFFKHASVLLSRYEQWKDIDK